MTSIRNSLRVVVFNSMVIWVSAVSAQEAKQPPPKAAPPPTPTVDLQFPGGTLEDYVRALQKAGPKINVVLASPDARQIKLPAIKLESVPVGAAVAFLNGDYDIDDTTTLSVRSEEFGRGPADAGTAPVYRIGIQGRTRVKSELVEVRVWNIGDLLGDDKNAAKILTAVETAVGLLGSWHGQAQIRYHEDTGLLVAAGDNSQLEAINRVVKGIREGAERSVKAALGASGEAVAGLMQWIEDIRRFDAEQMEKGKVNQQAFAKMGELTRLLDNVRAEIQLKEKRIAELERKLAERGGQ